MDLGLTRAGKCLASAALGLVLLSAAPAAAQQRQAPAKPAPPPAAQPKTAPDKKPWTVRMSREAPHTFTVKAKDASLSEVVEELGRLLKIPVNLSPLMVKQRVTVDFAGLTLDAALRALAPQPYVDFVTGGEDGNPRPLALYLHAFNEKEPSLTATVQGGSEALLLEGDTEEGVGDEEARRKREEANPLRVSYGHNQLTVKAKKQPLTVVLFKVASEMGVPFDLRWEPANLVDVDFTGLPVDQAVRTISPAVRLYYRLDAVSYQLQPLRLALVPPAQAGAQ
ncbi:MAG TPA: hypothetical protein VEY09_01515 [Pyrinomonadaceae bacterium]|nr:hypothetical protein [Pyrinomonadaceae bacterium]